MMTPFLGEFIGTGFLILMGTGVVANVLLHKSKGQNGGWLVIALGWGIAVFTGVYVSASSSGAHLNPAVTIAMATVNKLSWNDVPFYILAQFTGALTGALLSWLAYRQHVDLTDDPELKLAVFCNAPAVSNPLQNLLTETIATFVLVLGVLFLTGPEKSLGSLDALPVALLVTGIGLSLGGPTGYAVNPARDFAPRLLHFLLPIKKKRDSNWAYSWIPVVGPIIGGFMAAVIWKILH
jgi:glycerol uptake facilitator protein